MSFSYAAAGRDALPPLALKTNDRSGKSHVIHSTGNVFENLNDATITAAFPPWEKLLHTHKT